ncbi:hypothetical protein OIX85_002177 [Vibrio parahaemolyticus]|nr:hypothetical protein [Vibrio parahaemolyticus]
MLRAKNKEVRKWDLYKNMARVFGARKAKRLMSSLECCLSFNPYALGISGAVVWAETHEGVTYWNSLNRLMCKHFGWGF